ncbi:hypothetical protein HMPREF0868_0890 [Mageeibacillus indolicus UPII9-5]|uniref:Uncharacterized protein n=1 Tax=Mageeibacillus indolicus (strain UPII9-5) TaxID=699246 RepID=D3R1Z6_MAGIU|nr:hypothetical protein HMPREF0868_0890 [Mageeibacillus indolicus UPII9-5]
MPGFYILVVFDDFCPKLLLKKFFSQLIIKLTGQHNLLTTG